MRPLAVLAVLLAACGPGASVSGNGSQVVPRRDFTGCSAGSSANSPACAAILQQYDAAFAAAQACSAGDACAARPAGGTDALLACESAVDSDSTAHLDKLLADYCAAGCLVEFPPCPMPPQNPQCMQGKCR